LSSLAGRALVIGVGGGGLVTALVRQTSLAVVGVEIDAGVMALAREFFGLASVSADRVQLLIANGLDYLKAVRATLC
jgi:spermidine synthase